MSSGSLGMRKSRGGKAMVEGGDGSGNFLGFVNPMQSRDFYADQLSIPNVNWPVVPIAPTDLDNVFASFPIVEFDQTVETGRGFPDRCPGTVNGFAVDANRWKAGLTYKAATAPGVDSVVEFEIYYIRARDNAAGLPWASLGTWQVNVPSGGTLWQYESRTFVIGAGAGELNILAGEHVLFEFVRITPSSGTNLVGDAYVGAITSGWQRL